MLFCPLSLVAQDFRITQTVLGSGRLQVQFEAEPSLYYYILLRGDDLENVTTPVSLTLTTNALGQASDLVNASALTRYYRVQRVLRTQPLDSDNDGIDDLWELERSDTPLHPLDPTDATEDPDGDGRSNLIEYQATTFALTTFTETSPANGERGVAVTRETIFRFNHLLAPGTILTTNHVYATFGGRRILARPDISSDRKTVTLFYLEHLPASARVRVTFNGSGLTDYLGRGLDLDGNGQSGGLATIDFDTYSITPVRNTAITGHVFASEQVQGTNSTNFINRPLRGVRIEVDGAENSIFTVTDANGFFLLTNCPAGRFFVTIDGTQCPDSQWPNGSYYPFVGKAWEAVAGRTNLANTNGVTYLPLITAGTLQRVDAIQDTLITFPPDVIQKNPNLAGVSITVPANSLFKDDGTRGGFVGIAPVPPDRLPEPLPEGLEFPIVITVQTDGPLNFDRPAPVCFPNLPDPSTRAPLPAGTKNHLYSFNHDKGRWEAVAPMTVSADGKLICTDPGFGILQPGWHGSGPPPTTPPPPPDPCDRSNPATIAQTCSCFEEAADCRRAAYTEFVLCLAGPSLGAPTPIGVGVGVLLCSLALKVELDRCDDKLWACLGIGPPIYIDSFPVSPASGAIKSPSVFAQIVRIGEEIASTIAPYGTVENLPSEVEQRIEALLNEANSLAENDAGQFVQTHLNRTLRLREERLAELGAEFGEGRETAPAYDILYAAKIRGPDRVSVLRGRTSPLGQYSLFIPRNAIVELITFYDPSTTRFGIAPPRKWENSRYKLRRLRLETVADFPDRDADDLPDIVEDVYGTKPFTRDTDGDGVSDGAEVQQGTNPLDGLPAATGIIASSDTVGTAVDVSALNDIAVVADSSAGVTVFNVQGQNPIRIAQVDTLGNARRVALSGNFVAVADGGAGLAIIDITDPPAARSIHQVNLGGSVDAVAASGGIAYVGSSRGDIVAVDMASGAILRRVTLNAAVRDVAIAGDTLFALTDRLYSLAFADGFFDVLDSIPAPRNQFPSPFSSRLFAGTDLAYVTLQNGFYVFDVSDPNALSLARLNSTTQIGWKQIVNNGSGLGLGMVGVNSTTDDPHDLWLYDLKPGDTNAMFQTILPTPGLAHAVSLYNGLAYVADGDAGLQVINYLAYDSRATPPSITLSASFPLQSPTNGIAEEGKAVRVTARVADDVQVRNVEFYLDGVRVVTDGNYPFEQRIVTPVLSASKTNFTLRAKATDTGGNFAWSQEVVVTLVDDLTPPRVAQTFPRSQGIAGSVNFIAASFSERVVAENLNATTFRLSFAGADAVFGTADDALITDGTVVYRDELNVALMNFPTNLIAGLYLASISPPIADVAGNQLPAAMSWQFWVFDAQDSDHDGVPDSLEETLGFDAHHPDSDGDGISDGDEDLDGDGLRTNWEILFGYDPRNRDSDIDGVLDGQEDLDFDTLNNLTEMQAALNPATGDSDGDGWDDATERRDGTNPLDPNSGPSIGVVGSQQVAYFNGAADVPPSNFQWSAASAPAAYFNGAPETTPSNTTFSAFSLSVSYFNGTPDVPLSNATFSAFSPTVSYFNGQQENAATNTLWFVPSSPVSYLNTTNSPLLLLNTR